VSAGRRRASLVCAVLPRAEYHHLMPNSTAVVVMFVWITCLDHVFGSRVWITCMDSVCVGANPLLETWPNLWRDCCDA
jgi:hypothetical protein